MVQSFLRYHGKLLGPGYPLAVAHSVILNFRMSSPSCWPKVSRASCLQAWFCVLWHQKFADAWQVYRRRHTRHRSSSKLGQPSYSLAFQLETFSSAKLWPLVGQTCEDTTRKSRTRDCLSMCTGGSFNDLMLMQTMAFEWVKFQKQPRGRCCYVKPLLDGIFILGVL